MPFYDIMYSSRKLEYNKKEDLTCPSWVLTIYGVALNLWQIECFSYAYYCINNKAISENITSIRDVISKSFFLILSPPFLWKLASTQLLNLPNINVYQYFTFVNRTKKRKPYVSFYNFSNSSLPTPHLGHTQSSGNSSNGISSFSLSYI